ncbi:MAG TPA: DUF302 domain-containing protein [Gaiellaceae bacterium]|jgi:uncharacterized protein (DUF302 family)|nr:DUF302 domain-containing protein [Gaiellaceae bacterium]
MSTVTPRYTLNATTTLPFDDALVATREALAEENFGVLTEIDVAATLAEKLGVEREPYVILGACNPPFADQVLDADPRLGTLVPCNVCVAVLDGLTTIIAIDPERLLSLAGNDDLEPIAHEVHRRLQRVVDSVAAGHA